MIRVFLISDYELLRQGLTTLLDSESERFALIGTADHLDPEILPWGDAVPDVVLLDLETEPEQILPCLRQWRSSNGPKVLLLSRHDQPALQDKAVLAGARGVISHHSAAKLLLNAIEKVHEGQIWLGRQCIARLISSLPMQGVLPSLIQWESLAPNARPPGSDMTLERLHLRTPHPERLHAALDALGFIGTPLDVTQGDTALRATFQTAGGPVMLP